MECILVTGCAGFIASNFCSLFDKEFEIVGVDCLARGSHRENISKNIRFHEVDISSDQSLGEIFQRYPQIHGILNFAAETHVDHSLEDDAPFWKTNVLGVRNLARLALQKNIRLLQVSTDEVYGPSMDGTAFSEIDDLNPRNPYAASKAAAELLLMSYHHSYGLDCVITRGSNTIGPRQSFEKAVPKAILCFLKGQTFPLYKTPAKRMWLGVEDHCRAILAVFQKGKAGSIYNVSPDTSNEVETSLLIDQIQKLMGQGDIRLVDDRAAYDLRYLISSQRIREELHWHPKQQLPELIKETVTWYQNNPDWIQSHPSLVKS